MNEEGKPMHKSDGTAIWFEEAAEQLGVDTLRWMYLAQNPASRPAIRHAASRQPVTLQTLDGPHRARPAKASTTLQGHQQAGRRSPPAGADPAVEQLRVLRELRPAGRVRSDAAPQVAGRRERPEIDRWILSNLQALIGQTAAPAFEEFDTPAVCAAPRAFIDDLSNWYIRRNRRRFWRSRAIDGRPSDPLPTTDTTSSRPTRRCTKCWSR